MVREHRVIAALAGSPVPVARALALCEDDDVNDSAFYVMSRVDGVVADNVDAAGALDGAPARGRAGRQVVDVLADLHAVDAVAVGLADAVRSGTGFLARQLSRFAEMWTRNATRDLPAMAALGARLSAMAPPQRHTGIAHGDYRIGNVMLAPDGTLVAVLDWELWTVGDVLADLGFLLNNWYEPKDPTPQVFMEVPPTVTGELGSRADVLAAYAGRTGFDVGAIDYYRGFQHWRMAVLAEGVKRRYERAEMANVDVDFAHLDRRVLDLVELADEFLARYEAAARHGPLR